MTDITPAIAEYLDSLPPVDEAEVARVADAIKSEDERPDNGRGCQDGWDYDAVARSLVRAGVRVVQP